MPPQVICKCPLCRKDVWTHKPSAAGTILTRNKADLLIAFYHLGFESATKPTEASMQAALDKGALIHEQCCIRTNQVAGNPLLLAEYNRLRAAREVPLEPAPPFQNPDRSAAALLDKFAAADRDSRQQRAAPPRARAVEVACDAPTTPYRHTDATSTSTALPYVKGARHDPRTCIDADALERVVPSAAWPATAAYLRGRRLVDRDQIAAFAGLVVAALDEVAVDDAAGVLEFVRAVVPQLLSHCRQPGGQYLFTNEARRAPLGARGGANSLLYSCAPQRRRVATSALASAWMSTRMLSDSTSSRNFFVFDSKFFMLAQKNKYNCIVLGSARAAQSTNCELRAVHELCAPLVCVG